MSYETDLQYVKARLEQRRGKWRAIADNTGVNYRTLTRILEKGALLEGPRPKTVRTLYDFLQHDQAY